MSGEPEANVLNHAPAGPPAATSIRVPLLVRVVCELAFAAFILALALVSLKRIAIIFPDFEFFYKATRWLVEHGSLDRGVDVIDGRFVPRGGIEWYLPFVPRLLSPLALLSYQPAGWVWLCINLTAMVTTVRLIAVHVMNFARRDWILVQMMPVLFLGSYWELEFRLNQINVLTLLLMTAFLVHLQQGRRLVSGFWLGLAILIKLTPGLLLLWVLLKRQYRTAAVALATVVVAGPAGDLIVFGPQYTAEAYRIWFAHAVEKGSHRGLILNQQEMDWRNQALGAVVSRWLHKTNWSTTFDNDPRPPDDPVKRYLNVANLPRPQIVALVTALAGGSVLGLLWLARRPLEQCTPWQVRIEWALFILAMLWLMPVMRRYHIVWALPTLSILLTAVFHLGLRPAWSKVTVVAVAFVPLSQAALLSKKWIDTNVVEATGILLLSAVLLAVVMVWLLLWTRREPELLSDVPAEQRSATAASPSGPRGGRAIAPAGVAKHV